MKSELLKKLIRPTYMMWLFAALCIFFLFTNFIIWNEWREESKVHDENTRIKNDVDADKITTSSDSYLQITEFYIDIISTYGVKYNYKKGKGRNQGLNHYQRTDVVKEVYQLCKLLDIPFMLPVSIAAYESAFRPYVFTTNKNGEKLEVGLYQHRQGAVGQAWLAYHQLPPAYQKRCAFHYTGDESLEDPINATRIELVLLWGEKRDYANNKAFYVSSRHWGKGDIYPLYAGGIVPEKDFEFNKGTIKEDVRNPLMYYHIIRSYEEQFNKFSLKVWVETSGYAELYRKECSKLELGFIEGWKYAQTQIELSEEIKKETERSKKKVEKLELKYLDNIKKLDGKYRQLNGYLKRNEFQHVHDIWNEGMAHLKWLRDIIRDEEKKLANKIFVILYVIALVIMFICTIVVGILILKGSIGWMIKKVKKK